MAYGTTTNISYLGTMAAGAMDDGTGFTTGTKELVSLNKAVAGGIIQKTSTARQADNVADVNAIDRLGNRDILASGAFTGTVPSVYTSTVGVGMGMDRLTAHVNLMFGSSPIQMAQTFFISQSLVSNSKQLAPTLSKLNDGVDFGKFPNLDTLEYPANGIFPNFLGEGYPDYQSVVTNGISTFVTSATVENFQLLASDIGNLGSAFSVQDISNIGNPGQVISALNDADALTATGISSVLASINIDPSTIYNLGDPTYNVIMQAVLDSVTTPELIANAQTLLGSNIEDMTSLGDYTNFDKIFRNSKAVITFSSMQEFQLKLQAIELGRIETLAQLSTYVNSVEPVDLPTIGNSTVFVRRNYVDSLIAKFLGGTGIYESITLKDMLGTLGAVDIDVHSANWRTAMTALHTAGELTALSTHLTQLGSGLAGDFTTGTAPNFLLTDPDGPNITASVEGELYPSFQSNKIGQIEDDLQALMSRRNVNPDIQTAIDNWNLIFKKVFDEKDFQSRIDMNYDIRTDFSDNSFTFISGLRGTIDEDDKLPIVKGMVDQAIRDGDVGAEYVRAYIKELENKKRADSFDIRWRAEFDQ